MFDELTRCRPWIEAALFYGSGHHTFDDIAAGCYAGKFHLFAKPAACAVLEINQFPRAREMHIFLAGGDMAQFRDSAAELDELARQFEATALTMAGRKGWARVLDQMGWEVQPETTMRKPL